VTPRTLALTLACAVGLPLACKDGGPSGPTNYDNASGFSNVPAPPGGVAQFSVIPIAVMPGLTLTALGNLNPPGHVLPTDHVYFYAWDLSARVGTTTLAPERDVVMPATGTVTFMIQPGGTDWKVEFKATENFYFYLDHLVLTKTLKVGDIVTAGTLIGKTVAGGTLDLGAFDFTITNTRFVNPARLGMESLHVVSPWTYFTPALQAQLYPHVYRAPTASDKDGRVDFDIAGHLVGDWFLLGMPVDSSSGPYGWTRTVAFVYDYYDPSKVRISIGGTVASAGVWAIDSTATRPENITVASGVVPYLLYSPFDAGFPPYGLMLVQMVTDTQIKVQVFVGATTTNKVFDAGAITFIR